VGHCGLTIITKSQLYNDSQYYISRLPILFS